MKGHFITAGNRDRLYIQSILLLLELEIDCTYNPFLSKGKMVTVNKNGRLPRSVFFNWFISIEGSSDGIYLKFGSFSGMDPILPFLKHPNTESILYSFARLGYLSKNSPS